MSPTAVIPSELTIIADAEEAESLLQELGLADSDQALAILQELGWRMQRREDVSLGFEITES